MPKDDGFQRRKWGAQDNTDIPNSPYDEEEDLLQTQIWTPAPDILKLDPMMWLIVLEPIESRGVVISVKPNAVIGRKGDIRWDDEHMSRKHAQFMLIHNAVSEQEKVYAVTPLNDRNGTFINNQQIHHVTLLQENDEIEMGNTRFIVKVIE